MILSLYYADVKQEKIKSVLLSRPCALEGQSLFIKHACEAVALETCFHC